MKRNELRVWLIFLAIALVALLIVSRYGNFPDKIGLVAAILVGGILVRFRKK